MFDKKQVICSECGEEFHISFDDVVYTPTNCPSCDHEIESVSASKNGDKEIAWAK